MIVRLTHTARRASVSEADKRVAFSIAPTSASRNRSPSSSGFSPTTPPAPPIWKRHAGAEGFACPNCGVVGEPFRIATRPGVLTCRACRRQTGLTVGTVMERSHPPLSVWFWAAYLVASQTPGMSAVQFQRQLDLSRYETAFGILHKLRAGMVRPDQDRIGGKADGHVEVDEADVGGKTRGEGRGVHHKTLVVAAVEHREPGTAQDKRKEGRYAGRIRLAIAPDRGAGSLGGFVESAVMPGTSPTTGAATVACGSKNMTITPLPNAATPRCPRSSCRSSTSSSVI